MSSGPHGPIFYVNADAHCKQGPTESYINVSSQTLMSWNIFVNKVKNGTYYIPV